MSDNPNQSLWPELDPPADSPGRARGRAAAPEEVPPKAEQAATGRAPLMFCPHGGLTPWRRDYPTGTALCGRCERRSAEGCVLAGRPVEPDAPANCHTPGLTGLINAVGRW